MGFDGACDDFDYSQNPQDEDYEMTSPEKENFPEIPPNCSHTNSTIQTPYQTTHQQTKPDEMSQPTKTFDPVIAPPRSLKSTTNQQSSSDKVSPQTKDPESKPEPTTAPPRVHFPQREEQDVAGAFKAFAAQQGKNVESIRDSRARNTAKVDIQALKNFSTNLKLTTPVPEDIQAIVTKKPVSKTTTPTPTAAPETNFPKREKRDVAIAFKGFAAQQRRNIEAVRMSRAEEGHDREARKQALKDFSTGLKLTTPVPADIHAIMTKNSEGEKGKRSQAATEEK